MFYSNTHFFLWHLFKCTQISFRLPAGAAFLHDLRSVVARQFAEPIVAVDNGPIHYLSISKDKVGICLKPKGKEKAKYLRGYSAPYQQQQSKRTLSYIVLVFLNLEPEARILRECNWKFMQWRTSCSRDDKVYNANVRAKVSFDKFWMVVNWVSCFKLHSESFMDFKSFTGSLPVMPFNHKIVGILISEVSALEHSVCLYL